MHHMKGYTRLCITPQLVCFTGQTVTSFNHLCDHLQAIFLPQLWQNSSHCVFRSGWLIPQKELLFHMRHCCGSTEFKTLWQRYKMWASLLWLGSGYQCELLIQGVPDLWLKLIKLFSSSRLGDFETKNLNHDFQSLLEIYWWSFQTISVST